MVTADELAQIQRRMAEAGITNAGAYMRKMALNGYILHVDLAPEADRDRGLDPAPQRVQVVRQVARGEAGAKRGHAAAAA